MFLKNIYNKTDVFVSIERPSITEYRKYYTMSAYDISAFTSPFDFYLY